MVNNRKKAFALLMLVTIPLFFLFLGNHPLLEPDEGRYSEIPREMIERNEYVTPTLNYVKYFEKPILHYWLTALSFKAFGLSEFAARFWPAALGILGVIATFVLGESLYGTRAGLFAGIVLATSWIYFAISQINIIDMGLSVFTTVSLAGFLLGMIRDRRYLLLFYAGMGLATLAKGLIGIVLPCGIAAIWILLNRDWKLVIRSFYGWGILVFLAITLPWYVLVCMRNPEFFNFFFVHEHFLRYTTRIHGRYEPAWFFIPILLAGGLPWTGFWAPSLFRFRESKEKLYLFVWVAVIFLFFSFSDSKLVPYILPVFPSLSLIAGARLDRYLARPSDNPITRELVFSLLLLGVFTVALFAYPFLQDRFAPATLLRVTGPLAGVLVLMLLGAGFSWKKKLPKAVVATLFIGALASCLALKQGFDFYGTFHASKEIARIIERYQRPGDLVAEVGGYSQGLPFYLKTRVALVDYRGELKFGSKVGDQSQWFLDWAAFLEQWNSARPMIVVFEEKRYGELVAKGVNGMKILGKFNDAVVVTNRRDGER